MQLKKNDIVTLVIEDMTSEGNGVGRINGIPVFIPLTAVGDTVEVKIIKVNKNYCFGKTEKIIAPSATRIESDCAIFQRCGGCTYRHISYAEELRIKTKKVEDAFRRIAHSDAVVLPCISGNPEYYRNKTQLPVGDNKIGFYSRHSHTIVDIGDCKIQNKIFNKIIEVVREWVDENNISFYNEATGTGFLRHIYLRIGESTKDLMLCLCVRGRFSDTFSTKYDKLVAMFENSDINITSFIYNINNNNNNVILGSENVHVSGEKFISDKLLDLTFEISPQSFYQINHDQTEKLYNKIIELAQFDGTETVLDLYCGIGTITLCVAKHVKEIFGVELVHEAIANAKENARLNSIENAKFKSCDSAEAGKWLASLNAKPDTIIVDPPRKGLSQSVLLDIMAMNPAKIIYVSCDPATLARDAQILIAGGYAIRTVQPLDMFPRTPHVETVVLMSRQNP